MIGTQLVHSRAPKAPINLLTEITKPKGNICQRITRSHSPLSLRPDCDRQDQIIRFMLWRQIGKSRWTEAIKYFQS